MKLHCIINGGFDCVPVAVVNHFGIVPVSVELLSKGPLFYFILFYFFGLNEHFT